MWQQLQQNALVKEDASDDVVTSRQRHFCPEGCWCPQSMTLFVVLGWKVVICCELGELAGIVESPRPVPRLGRVLIYFVCSDTFVSIRWKSIDHEWNKINIKRSYYFIPLSLTFTLISSLLHHMNYYQWILSGTESIAWKKGASDLDEIIKHFHYSFLCHSKMEFIQSWEGNVRRDIPQINQPVMGEIPVLKFTVNAYFFNV